MTALKRPGSDSPTEPKRAKKATLKGFFEKASGCGERDGDETSNAAERDGDETSNAASDTARSPQDEAKAPPKLKVPKAKHSNVPDIHTAKIDIWKIIDKDEPTVKQGSPECDEGQEKFTCNDCGCDKEIGQAYITSFYDDNADAEDEQKRNRKCTTLADLQGKSARCTDCHRLRTRLTTVLKRNSNVRGSWGEISKETKQQFMKDHATLMGDQLAKRMTEVVCEHKIHKQIAVLSECR